MSVLTSTGEWDRITNTAAFGPSLLPVDTTLNPGLVAPAIDNSGLT